MNKKVKIAILPTIISPYRKGFYDRILQIDEFDVQIFCQRKILGTNLKCISKNYPNNVKFVDFISTNHGTLSFQFLPIFKLIKNFDVIIISGNPRVISDFLFGIFLRLIGKPVIIWTMVKSYRANKFTQFLRLSWVKLFKYILLYTDNEVYYLRENGFRKQCLVGINNGLDQKLIDENVKQWDSSKLDIWLKQNSLSDKRMILSLARLERKNKFELVLKSLPIVIEQIPDIHWCLIGDGEDFEKLKHICKEYNIENHVTFVGSIYEEEFLTPYFLSALLFVHPAAIGLSLLHAFGYGLPVITHSNSDLHGPEYGAFQNGITGLNYIYDDYKSLANVIIQLINLDQQRKTMALETINIAREKYNVDVMVDRFIEITNKAINKVS